MKTSQIFKTSLLTLIFTPLILVGCNKPKQRTEMINPKIEDKVVAVNSLHDVTSNSSKAYFYKDIVNEDIKKNDSTEQLKINVDNQKVINLVTGKLTSASLNETLKSGLIAFMILPDQVKIYGVVKKEDLKTNSNPALTLTDLQEIKKQALDTAKIESTAIEISTKKDDIQFVEIASIKIDKAGVIENEKTKFYEEKMSSLGVAERDLNLSTHILLKEEIQITTESQLDF